ncbi:MAG: HAMP domain-containing histidine kinase [Firmicutes bacterium]|jgi:histidine kinase|nr:HAMP domain-containing histidine kinase [Bacillota bacterium]
MKTKKKTSIQAKTLFFLLTYNIVIILLLWVCQIKILDIYYEKEQVDNMNNIVKSLNSTDSSNLTSTIQDIAYENDVCIVLSDDISVVGAYNINMNGCILKNNNSKVRELMYNFVNSDETFKSYKFINEDKHISALLYGIKLDNKTAFIYSNLEDISDFTILIKQQLMYVCIIGIFIAIIISIFLSSKITEPITKITKKAKKLGSGDTEVTFEESGIKEIDELSEALTQAQMEMVKTDELRRDLMANVSHDLKTPLTMIKAYAEMIRDISYKDHDKMNEHLGIIVDETDRLTVLVNDILDLSRMQSNADTLSIETFDLADNIKTIVNRYQIIKETEKYIINVEMPESIKIKADKKKINQVIYNLINNAINYTGKDKTVTVRVTKHKKYYLVEIIDTGKGIKESEIPYIWNKYYKNDKNHQRNVVSTGLGLSIVKEILELHGYEYGVKSVLKKGSTFYFKIKI